MSTRRSANAPVPLSALASFVGFGEFVLCLGIHGLRSRPFRRIGDRVKVLGETGNMVWNTGDLVGNTGKPLFTSGEEVSGITCGKCRARTRVSPKGDLDFSTSLFDRGMRGNS